MEETNDQKSFYTNLYSDLLKKWIYCQMYYDKFMKEDDFSDYQPMEIGSDIIDLILEISKVMDIVSREIRSLKLEYRLGHVLDKFEDGESSSSYEKFKYMPILLHIKKDIVIIQNKLFSMDEEITERYEEYQRRQNTDDGTYALLSYITSHPLWQ